MADIKPELKPVDDQQNYAVGNNSDPKNMQELTQYVSNYELIHNRVKHGNIPLT